MATTSFRGALEQIKDNYLDAVKDGNLCAHDYLRLSADACQSLEALLRGIGEDDAAFDALVTDVEDLVKTHIVPINLNQKFKVPRLMEKIVIDPYLSQGVRPFLELLRPEPHEKH